MFKKILSRDEACLVSTIIVCFFLTTLGPICPIPSFAAGEEFRLPAPGTMVNLTPAYMPVIIKGMKVH